MEKRELIREGKAKRIYSTDSEDLVIQEFKDSATAFDGKKRADIKDKGVANARISAIAFQFLEERGIRTHFQSYLDEGALVTERLEMISLEAVVRNVVAGSLAERLGYPEGKALEDPIVEFYYKNDELGDPLLTEDHIRELGLVSPGELRELRKLALEINAHLQDLFERASLDLIDFKLEFGRAGRALVLGDEISPDTCRLWDKMTGEKLDKDRFRRDMGGVTEAYQEILKRTQRVAEVTF